MSCSLLFTRLSTPPKAVDANTIKEVCTKYIYNKAPAIAAVGTYAVVLTPSEPDRSDLFFPPQQNAFINDLI